MANNQDNKIKISGFTFIRNGEKLGYPYIESILSILPICYEFIVVVGNCEDNTRQKIMDLNNRKIKIIDTVWDDNLRIGGEILAQQTNIALDNITGDWGFYLQGDEVVHEKYLDEILNIIQNNHLNFKIEGFLFNYTHFYGNYQWVATALKWYRKEIRIVRNNIGIRSYKDAQGFRKNDKKLQVKSIDAHIFHYGWCRPPAKQQLKLSAFQKLYHNDNWLNKNLSKEENFDYTTIDSLEIFQNSHPKVMQEIVKNYDFELKYDPKKVKNSLKNKFRLYIEKLTGYRLWEYKNYILSN